MPETLGETTKFLKIEELDEYYNGMLSAENNDGLKHNIMAFLESGAARFDVPFFTRRYIFPSVIKSDRILEFVLTNKDKPEVLESFLLWIGDEYVKSNDSHYLNSERGLLGFVELLRGISDLGNAVFLFEYLFKKLSRRTSIDRTAEGHKQAYVMVTRLVEIMQERGSALTESMQKSIEELAKYEPIMIPLLEEAFGKDEMLGVKDVVFKYSVTFEYELLAEEVQNYSSLMSSLTSQENRLMLLDGILSNIARYDTDRDSKFTAVLTLPGLSESELLAILSKSGRILNLSVEERLELIEGLLLNKEIKKILVGSLLITYGIPENGELISKSPDRESILSSYLNDKKDSFDKWGIRVVVKYIKAGVLSPDKIEPFSRSFLVRAILDPGYSLTEVVNYISIFEIQDAEILESVRQKLKGELNSIPVDVGLDKKSLREYEHLHELVETIHMGRFEQDWRDFEVSLGTNSEMIDMVWNPKQSVIDMIQNHLDATDTLMVDTAIRELESRIKKADLKSITFNSKLERLKNSSPDVYAKISNSIWAAIKRYPQEGERVLEIFKLEGSWGLYDMAEEDPGREILLNTIREYSRRQYTPRIQIFVEGRGWLGYDQANSMIHQGAIQLSDVQGYRVSDKGYGYSEDLQGVYYSTKSKALYFQRGLFGEGGKFSGVFPDIKGGKVTMGSIYRSLDGKTMKEWWLTPKLHNNDVKFEGRRRITLTGKANTHSGSYSEVYFAGMEEASSEQMKAVLFAEDGVGIENYIPGIISGQSSFKYGSIDSMTRASTDPRIEGQIFVQGLRYLTTNNIETEFSYDLYDKELLIRDRNALVNMSKEDFRNYLFDYWYGCRDSNMNESFIDRVVFSSKSSSQRHEESLLITLDKESFTANTYDSEAALERAQLIQKKLGLDSSNTDSKKVVIASGTKNAPTDLDGYKYITVGVDGSIAVETYVIRSLRLLGFDVITLKEAKDEESKLRLEIALSQKGDKEHLPSELINIEAGIVQLLSKARESVQKVVSKEIPEVKVLLRRSLLRQEGPLDAVYDSDSGQMIIQIKIEELLDIFLVQGIINWDLVRVHIYQFIITQFISLVSANENNFEGKELDLSSEFRELVDVQSLAEELSFQSIRASLPQEMIKLGEFGFFNIIDPYDDTKKLLQQDDNSYESVKGLSIIAAELRSPSLTMSDLESSLNDINRSFQVDQLRLFEYYFTNQIFDIDGVYKRIEYSYEDPSNPFSLNTLSPEQTDLKISGQQLGYLRNYNMQKSALLLPMNFERGGKIKITLGGEELVLENRAGNYFISGGSFDDYSVGKGWEYATKSVSGSSIMTVAHGLRSIEIHNGVVVIPFSNTILDLTSISVVSTTDQDSSLSIPNPEGDKSSIIEIEILSSSRAKEPREDIDKPELISTSLSIAYGNLDIWKRGLIPLQNMVQNHEDAGKVELKFFVGKTREDSIWVEELELISNKELSESSIWAVEFSDDNQIGYSTYELTRVGESTKRDDSEQAGRFGEGLDMAALACINNGFNIQYSSRNWAATGIALAGQDQSIYHTGTGQSKVVPVLGFQMDWKEGKRVGSSTRIELPDGSESEVLEKWERWMGLCDPRKKTTKGRGLGRYIRGLNADSEELEHKISSSPVTLILDNQGALEQVRQSDGDIYISGYLLEQQTTSDATPYLFSYDIPDPDGVNGRDRVVANTQLVNQYLDSFYMNLPFEIVLKIMNEVKFQLENPEHVKEYTEFLMLRHVDKVVLKRAFVQTFGSGAILKASDSPHIPNRRSSSGQYQDEATLATISATVNIESMFQSSLIDLSFSDKLLSIFIEKGLPNSLGLVKTAFLEELEMGDPQKEELEKVVRNSINILKERLDFLVEKFGISKVSLLWAQKSRISLKEAELQLVYTMTKLSELLSEDLDSKISVVIKSDIFPFYGAAQPNRKSTKFKLAKRTLLTEDGTLLITILHEILHMATEVGDYNPSFTSLLSILSDLPEIYMAEPE